MGRGEEAPQGLLPSKVNKHKVFPLSRSKAGELTLNVWVNVSYSNGTKTGGGTRGGCYEASEPLCMCSRAPQGGRRTWPVTSLPEFFNSHSGRGLAC
jgi:hypothetical protein